MDHKLLFQRLQETIGEIETSQATSTAISEMARVILRNFRKELGMTGARLYELDGNEYELIERVGDVRKAEVGIRVPVDYAPIARVIEGGLILMEPDDPGIDPVLEARLGAGRFAAFTIGDLDERILSLNVSKRSSRDEVLLSLSLIRQAMLQRLRQQHFDSIIEEAKKIQQSILPSRPPSHPALQIGARTVPAEGVSGDYYDFIPLEGGMIGFAIADATGHGLPAALVVRDIHMGLRMGVDRDFKIVRTIQKLNHIIHHSRISTKFVSLFYGELESNGTFIYSNAGHPPPFVIKRTGPTLYLHEGGPIIGPTPDPVYNRGYVALEKGDILCLYTDGIVEAANRKDQEFGVERLVRLIKKNQGLSAVDLTNLVLDKVRAFEHAVLDDKTLVIVKITR